MMPLHTPPAAPVLRGLDSWAPKSGPDPPGSFCNPVNSSLPGLDWSTGGPGPALRTQLSYLGVPPVPLGVQVSVSSGLSSFAPRTSIRRQRGARKRLGKLRHQDRPLPSKSSWSRAGARMKCVPLVNTVRATPGVQSLLFQEALTSCSVTVNHSWLEPCRA